MPWAPELFSAPVLEQFLEKARAKRLAAIPYFAGMMANETNALTESFAGEPELHHPIRGRIKGARPSRSSSRRRGAAWSRATSWSRTST